MPSPRWLFVVSTVILLMAMAGCRPKMVTVSSGEKVVCNECNKVTHSDIQTKQVKEAEASNYTVREIKEICHDCQVKIEEKRKAEEKRRQEEIARQERERRKNQIVGTWVYRWSMADVILKLNSDGTGSFMDERFTWRLKGNGFTGSLVLKLGIQTRDVPVTISGQITETGRMLVNMPVPHWDWLLSPEMVFERL